MSSHPCHELVQQYSRPVERIAWVGRAIQHMPKNSEQIYNISAARAVHRELNIWKIWQSFFFQIVWYWSYFWIWYGIPEVREVSKNLPGARGFFFPKYQPIPSHGDPIHAWNGLNFRRGFLDPFYGGSIPLYRTLTYGIQDFLYGIRKMPPGSYGNGIWSTYLEKRKHKIRTTTHVSWVIQNTEIRNTRVQLLHCAKITFSKWNNLTINVICIFY